MDEIKLNKGRDGWHAETLIPLDITKTDNMTKRALPMFLVVSTDKGSTGGIYTSANAMAIYDGGRQWDVFGDFAKALKKDRAARCTEKTVLAMHEAALEQRDALIAEAKAFYAKKLAEAA